MTCCFSTHDKSPCAYRSGRRPWGRREQESAGGQNPENTRREECRSRPLIGRDGPRVTSRAVSARRRAHVEHFVSGLGIPGKGFAAAARLTQERVQALVRDCFEEGSRSCTCAINQHGYTCTYTLRSYTSTQRDTRDARSPAQLAATANLRTKILHFRGFDSSAILGLWCGIFMSIGNVPDTSSQPVLLWIILVGNLSREIGRTRWQRFWRRSAPGAAERASAGHGPSKPFTTAWTSARTFHEKVMMRRTCLSSLCLPKVIRKRLESHIKVSYVRSINNVHRIMTRRPRRGPEFGMKALTLASELGSWSRFVKRTTNNF